MPHAFVLNVWTEKDPWFGRLASKRQKGLPQAFGA